MGHGTCGEGKAVSQDEQTIATVDEIEQRMATRILKYFLISFFTIVFAAFGVGSWVNGQQAQINTNTKDVAELKQTVAGDAAFKSKVSADIEVLKEKADAQQRATDRMDNKLDRVIRVYEVPK